MGVDPNTGIYTPDVSYQPTGAMGAVTSLLNSQKANQIAQTLQQQREAQAQMEQQQAQQYQMANERAEAGRQATMGAVNNAPPGQDLDMNSIIRANMGATGDTSQFMPYITKTTTAATSAAGKLDVEKIKARTAMVLGAVKTGMDPNTAISLASTDMTPEEVAALKANIPANVLNAPAPVPASIATKNTGIGNLANSRAAATTAETPSVINKNNAVAAAQRAIAGLKQAQSALAGQEKISPAQYANLMKNVEQYDVLIRNLTIDKYGLPVEQTPETQALVDTYRQRQKVLMDMAKQKVAAGAPAGSPQFPSLFNVQTPGAGTATTAGAGSSSQKPVATQIMLPPLPGQ